MGEECPICGADVNGDTRDCGCGYRVLETRLSEEVEALMGAIGGWRKVSESQVAEIAALTQELAEAQASNQTLKTKVKRLDKLVRTQNATAMIRQQAGVLLDDRDIGALQQRAKIDVLEKLRGEYMQSPDLIRDLGGIIDDELQRQKGGA